MTIPVSPTLVQSNPGVLTAGGSALALNGLCLTATPNRIPMGAVASFPNAPAVAAWFGPASEEANVANTYFGSYTNTSLIPGALLFAQYPLAPVAAFLRGSVSGLSLAQIQQVQPSVVTASIGGSVTGAVGWTGTGTAASNNMTISASTGLISTGDLVVGSGVSPGTYITGQVSGTVGGNGVYSLSAVATSAGAALTGQSTVMNVTAVASGSIQPNDQVSGTISFTTANVVAQLSGTLGGVGTYRVSTPFQAVSQTITDLSAVLNVTSSGATALVPGLLLTGTNVTVGSRIVAQLSGTTGGVGNYSLSLSSTTVSEAITAAYDLSVTINGVLLNAASVNLAGATSFSNAAALIQSALTSGTMSYDSITGTFLLASTTTGPGSTMTYGSGALASLIGLTQLSGAMLSQGANPALPGPFMTSLIGVTTNWASFFTEFDPDLGQGNANKILFAKWTAQQNNRFAYIVWDTDQTPGNSNSAPNSLGAIVAPGNPGGLSGTSVFWEPNQGAGPNYYSLYHTAALVAGIGASINVNQTNGRITLAYKSQAGFTPTVTNATTAANLIANGYNFYGAYGLGNNQWSFLQPGSIGGQFRWWDSYMNQISMNAKFTADLVSLMANSNSLPFNPQGYGSVDAALQNDIQTYVAFGAIRPGVLLSAAQAQAVDNAAGIAIDTVLSTRGWYVQVVPASPTLRAARGPVQVNFWYCDGGSIQSINLSSVMIQ